MKPGIENTKTKSIIWGISPWTALWSMGERAGTPTLYYSLSALANAGHEIHLFALNDGISKEEETYEGIYFHRFKVPLEKQIRALQGILGRIKYLGFIGTGLLQPLYVSLYTLAAIRRVRREGKKAGPSLVYAYSSYSAPAAYILGRLYHIPNITRLFGTFITSRDISSRLRLLLKWQEVLAFKVPCKYLIITNDGTQGDKAAQKLGVPNERLKFWRNGVNKNMYTPSFNVADFKKGLGLEPSIKIVLTVSRLVGWKHLERLIKAVPSITSQYRKVVFLILGDGPEREKLEKLSQTLGVSQYIRFMGAVTLGRVADYMNAADIFVLVNDFSNLSNGLYEAMVWGKCIVTLDNGDTGEVIEDGETGRLVRAGGEDEIVSELSRAIVGVLDDEGVRTRLGENARIYAQEHFQTWEERTAMEVKLVEELVGKGG